MPLDHLILCGGTTASGGRKRQWASTVSLDTPTPGDGNVHLRVDDIVRAMETDLPEAVVDLLELATYVYCADQATIRGGKATFEYGAHWRRRFHFRVPVRRPDVWRDTAVMEELTRTISFLSDDDYSFEFFPRRGAPPINRYLWGEMGPMRGEVDTVMLFSGGLDSLGGAIEEVFGDGHRVALVSHRPVSTIDKRQKDLVGQLSLQASQRGRPLPLHVSVWADKEKYLGREYTQRTRSFLFGAMGMAVARSFGLDAVKFYENGVVSMNLPICAQVLGGRASRTTHPQVMSRMQSLFSRVLERPFRIENPFLWKSKTDVTAGIRSHGLSDLVARTVSCAHTWEVTRDQPHCGKCSQCIDRRLAVLAAGLSDAEDPAAGYRTDVLHGSFAGVEHQTMVERVVGMAHHVGKMTNAIQLFGAFGEASRAVLFVPGESADVVAEHLFKLWQRHAGQVRDAIRYAAATAWSAAPGPAGGCLLAVSGPSNGEKTDEKPEPFRLDLGIDLLILRTLAEAPNSTVLKSDLAIRTDVSRKTIGLRVNEFLRRRLIRHSGGPRSGVTITTEGLAALESAEKDAARFPPPVTKAAKTAHAITSDCNTPLAARGRTDLSGHAAS